MFKVGDDVVSKVNVHGYPDLALKVHKVTFVDHGIVVINNEFYFKHEELQHATPEEIAEGHRIDCETLGHPEDYTSPNCKKIDLGQVK